MKRLGRENVHLPFTIIARLDGNRTVLGGDWTRSSEWELFYTVDACQRVGAGAAIVNLLLGSPAELASLKVVAQAATACERAGIPLFVSAMSFGEVVEDWADVHRQAFSARMAYELGADVVSLYGATGRTLNEAGRWCPCPLYAQGAPSSDSYEDLALWARECASAGGAGVVAGRSVWQSPDPHETVRALLEGLADPGAPLLSRGAGRRATGYCRPTSVSGLQQSRASNRRRSCSAASTPWDRQRWPARSAPR